MSEDSLEMWLRVAAFAIDILIISAASSLGFYCFLRTTPTPFYAILYLR